MPDVDYDYGNFVIAVIKLNITNILEKKWTLMGNPLGPDLSSSCFMLFKVHCTLRFESWRTGYFSNIIDASHYKISKEYEVL